MNTGWKHLKEEQPTDGQDVFYYFGVFNQVYAGRYRKGEEENIGGEMICIADNIFFGGGGYLGDDVTWWMPRNSGDPLPEIPTISQRKNDIYHPYEPSITE